MNLVLVTAMAALCATVSYSLFPNDSPRLVRGWGTVVSFIACWLIVFGVWG